MNATPFLLLTATVAAQAMAWRPIHASPWGRAAVFDEVRERVVVFGARDNALWEWDGTRWARRPTVDGPSPRDRHAMVYDSARQRIVVFGGYDWSTGDRLGETWEWDGMRWFLRRPQHSPPARADHAMAYDAARQRTVLFGGDSGTRPGPEDTWEWDGTDWTQRITPTSPKARNGPAMAFDRARGRTVMFGGRGDALHDETWEWDGVDWQLLNPANSPGALWFATLAYDVGRRRTVLFGGQGPVGGPSAETWEWNGIDWIQRTTTTGPVGRSGFAMAYDAARREVVMAGGQLIFSDTWTWDGVAWRMRAESTRPVWLPPRTAVYAASRARVLTVPAYDYPGACAASDVFAWDGVAWHRHTSVTGPAPRLEHAVAYDDARGRLVLFGGVSGVAVDDTWEWDGTQWHRMQPSTAPWPRFGHAMAYDATRSRVVLRGGAVRSGRNLVLYGDTWEWDGATWTYTSGGSNGLFGHALCFDPVRGRVLSYGGSADPRNAQLQEWNGATWSRLQGGEGPAYLAGHALVADPVRRRVVMTGGGTSPVTPNPYTWEWDGAEWTKHEDPAWLSHPTVAVFDERLGRVVAVSGDVWIYDADAGPSATDYGRGCGGSRGEPVLTNNDPRLGNQGFRLDLHSVRASTPCAFGLSLRPGATSVGPCTLLLDAAVITLPATSTASGFATTSFAMPFDLRLRGLRVYAQALAIEANPSVFGFALSAGRELRLGY